MLKHWKRTLSLLAVAAAVGLVSAGLALGKKPPPDPDPEPPPITYSITFLGTLLGDTISDAYDVNGSGEVVGSSDDSNGSYRAFLWTESDGMKALNDLMSDEDKLQWDLRAAFGINNAGQICGVGRLNGDTRAYRFTPRDGETPAVVVDLGTFGGNLSVARAINEKGDVAGYAEDADGTDRAFVYTNATAEMVNICAGKALGINKSGQVAGTSHTLLDNGWKWEQAFRYTPGVGMENLGDFGTNPRQLYRSYGRDINDAGHVAGEAGNAPKFKGLYPIHAFLYTDQMIDLGALGGGNSSGQGVNTFDHVVGVGNYPDGFLYIEEFGMLKLEDLIPGFQGPLYPTSINDAGQICGHTYGGEAFLLTPDP